MDKIDILLRNPYYLHCALLRVIPKTNDKETYELQKALLAVNYANILLIQEKIELKKKIKEPDKAIGSIYEYCQE
ncbi:MAG: hypothetical protein FWG77_04955 [Treponema sp.]|nr:hypothetical protein [Treponema sp.]